MNRMQNFAGILIVVCTFFFAFVHADDQEDHIALLERAFEAGKKASYCAETEIPSGEADSIILQPCTLYNSLIWHSPFSPSSTIASPCLSIVFSYP